MRFGGIAAGVLLMGPVAVPSGCYAHADVGPGHVQLYRGAGVAIQIALATPRGLPLQDGHVGFAGISAWVVGRPGANTVLVEFEWR